MDALDPFNFLKMHSSPFKIAYIPIFFLPVKKGICAPQLYPVLRGSLRMPRAWKQTYVIWMSLFLQVHFNQTYWEMRGILLSLVGAAVKAPPTPHCWIL